MIVEFTVTETGSVENVSIVKSCVYNRKGNCSNKNTFNRSAMVAAQKFKYSPRFVDGYPTRTTGVQNRMDYSVQ